MSDFLYNNKFIDKESISILPQPINPTYER